MNDDSLRAVWLSNQPPDKETLVRTVRAVLDEDRAAQIKDRWVTIATVIVLCLVCPTSLWFAAYGKTPLVRGAYALMGAGTAIAVFADWMYLTWSGRALPGPADIRSQLQTTALLLGRQANLLKTGPLWSAPVFLGAALISLWIYQERSHAEAFVLGAIVGTAWLVGLVAGVARGKRIDERRSRMEGMLADWET
jgi:hypothetical protein